MTDSVEQLLGRWVEVDDIVRAATLARFYLEQQIVAIMGAGRAEITETDDQERTTYRPHTWTVSADGSGYVHDDDCPTCEEGIANA